MRPFHPNGVFQSSEHKDAITRQAIRGAGATMASGGVILCTQIIATVVLARLLVPRDFGIVAMVTTFSQFLMNFGLNGFTEVVLQWDEIDHTHASNLFWINLGSGLLLTIGFAAAGLPLARFYHDPLVAHVAMGMSLTIVFMSTSVLHVALLKRALHFPATSANDIIARLASVAVSILLGLAGWGYWALVAGAITLPLATSIGAWYMCRWVPGLPRRAAGTWPMVRFALSVYGRFNIGYFTQNMGNILVGWRFGAVSLGFYKKAYDLFALSGCQITAPLTNVAVSALSRFRRNPLEYKRHLLNALGLLAFGGMGLGADLSLVGKDVIRLLLGPQWGEAGRIFTFLGPGVGIMVFYYAHGWLHLSLGRADRWLRWAIVECSFTALLFLLALPWGPKGIALAWTASFWILTIPAFWYAGKPLQLGILPVLAVVWRHVLASVMAWCAGVVIITRMPFLMALPTATGAFVRVVAVSMVFVFLYLAAVVLLHQGLGPLRQAADILRDMVPWAKRPATAVCDPPELSVAGE